jgi:hypothetical protein
MKLNHYRLLSFYFAALRQTSSSAKSQSKDKLFFQRIAVGRYLA